MKIKFLSFVYLFFGVFCAQGQISPPPATVGDVLAGTDRYKYITSKTLRDAGVASPTNGITAATATNIANAAVANGNAASATTATTAGIATNVPPLLPSTTSSSQHILSSIDGDGRVYNGPMYDGTTHTITANISGNANGQTNTYHVKDIVITGSGVTAASTNAATGLVSVTVSGGGGTGTIDAASLSSGTNNFAGNGGGLTNLNGNSIVGDVTNVNNFAAANGVFGNIAGSAVGLTNLNPIPTSPDYFFSFENESYTTNVLNVISNKGLFLIGANASTYSWLTNGNLIITNEGFGGVLKVNQRTNIALYLIKKLGTNQYINSIRKVQFTGVWSTNNANSANTVYSRFPNVSLWDINPDNGANGLNTLSGTNLHMSFQSYQQQLSVATNGLNGTYTNEVQQGRDWINARTGLVDGGYRSSQWRHGDKCTVGYEFINDKVMRTFVSGQDDQIRYLDGFYMWRDIRNMYFETIGNDANNQALEFCIQSGAIWTYSPNYYPLIAEVNTNGTFLRGELLSTAFGNSNSIASFNANGQLTNVASTGSGAVVLSSSPNTTNATLQQTTLIDLGPTRPTRNRFFQDAVRTPGLPVTVLQATETNSSTVLDLMPRVTGGVATTNWSSAGNVWIDLVDRDLTAPGINSNIWGVARIAIQANGSELGAPSVHIGGFSSGGVSTPNVYFNFGQLWLNQSASTVGLIYNSALHYGNAASGQLPLGFHFNLDSSGNLKTDGSIVSTNSGNIVSITPGNIVVSGTIAATNGIASYATPAVTPIASTGWTNIWSTNAAIVYFSATSCTWTNRQSDGTGIYTNETSATFNSQPVYMQPGERLNINGTSVTGIARKF